MESATTPTVSVLMTAYNRERFIVDAIESVLASSFRDFELVIVDDASGDRTWHIIQEFARRDERIRPFRNEHNLGDYPNRNRAAEVARGKYLKYVDSDDKILPHGLATMVTAMEAHPRAALGLSFSKTEGLPGPVELSPVEAYRRHFLEDGLFGCGPLGVIIRAECFRERGGFSGQRYVGDLELWGGLAARHPVVLIPNGLVWWREHEGQEYLRGITTGLYPQLTHNTSIRSLVDSACPLPQTERAQALERVRRQTVLQLWGMVRKGRLGWALRLYRETGLTIHQLLRAATR